jgi:hypothetical protein
MGRNLLIKENIPSAFINQTNNTCYGDISYSQSDYGNPGIEKWVGVNYINDYMSLQNNIDLGSNTLLNRCKTINVNSLKNIPDNISKNEIKLSEDNIKLMSGCEFNNNVNILTGQPCLETMQNYNVMSDMGDIKLMSNFEKGYLIAFTLLFVGLLYEANNKLTGIN